MRYKHVLYLLIFAVACVGIARFCHKQTCGFAMSKITHNFSLEEIPSTSDLVNPSLLHQKFYFYNRGFQSFVFISEDGQLILKLFSNSYQKKQALFSLLSPIPLLKNWAVSQKKDTERKIQEAFSSYQLAFNEMKERTGLLYMHLNPTLELPSQLTLVDKLNIEHNIDPNQFAFLLQKKVTLSYPLLESWIKSSELKLAQQAITSLIELFIWKWKHAIIDKDPLIRTNYGFIGTTAIQIDVGPLSKRDKPEDKQSFEIELKRIFASLKYWLTQNAPELICYLDQELENHLSSKE